VRNGEAAVFSVRNACSLILLKEGDIEELRDEGLAWMLLQVCKGGLRKCSILTIIWQGFAVGSKS
jgi:hypothetical protein